MSKPLSELATLAQEAIELACQDRAAARATLVATVLADAALQARHLEYIVGIWAEAEISTAITNRRATVMREVTASVERVNGTAFQSALREAAANNLARFADMPIWGGKRLADATPAELRESARRYALLSSDAARKSRWQELVADAADAKVSAKRKATPETPIGTLLDEVTLRNLWEQADA
ncbi:hypothetical protein J3454_14250 [Erythrobacter sp. NFXS35]|uniref:hypothetical protein n=1 Tax=Erythrobacter sp. NFXS35 TaxID=2818436 RepID=UPI0032E0440A